MVKESGRYPKGSGQSAQPEPVSRLRHTVTVPNAGCLANALFDVLTACNDWAGKSDAILMEMPDLSHAWEVLGAYWGHPPTECGCDSFGEYASRCFAGGRNG